MKFEISCDELHPDVLWSRSNRKADYALIGSLGMPAVASMKRHDS